MESQHVRRNAPTRTLSEAIADLARGRFGHNTKFVFKTDVTGPVGHMVMPVIASSATDARDRILEAFGNTVIVDIDPDWGMLLTPDGVGILRSEAEDIITRRSDARVH